MGLLGEQLAQRGFGALEGLGLDGGLGVVEEAGAALQAVHLGAQGLGARVLRRDLRHAGEDAFELVGLAGVARGMGLGRQGSDGAVLLLEHGQAQSAVFGALFEGTLQAGHGGFVLATAGQHLGFLDGCGSGTGGQHQACGQTPAAQAPSDEGMLAHGHFMETVWLCCRGR